jgi:hypothetical protein
MPADFDKCVKGGGKVRTINVGDDKYMRICILDGTTHHGEVKKKQKSEGSMEQAVAAQKFSKVEVTSDGTRKGTVVKVNGATVPNMRTFSFTFWDDDYGQAVSMGFSTAEEPKPGTLQQTQYFRLVPPSQEEAEATIKQALASQIPPELIPRREQKMWKEL